MHCGERGTHEIDRIVVRSDVANWPLPSPWPIAMGIGSAVMAVPVAIVTDRSDLGRLLLVPILLAVGYQTLMVVRLLWCDRHPYLSQRWLDGAKNVLGNALIDGALIRLRDAAPRRQDRVLRRIEMIEAIRRTRGSGRCPEGGSGRAPKRVFIRGVDRVMSDPENRGAAASSTDDADRSGELGDSILDALDMEGVEDTEIAFDRPVSYPRPATFE